MNVSVCLSVCLCFITESGHKTNFGCHKVSKFMLHADHFGSCNLPNTVKIEFIVIIADIAKRLVFLLPKRIGDRFFFSKSI